MAVHFRTVLRILCNFVIGKTLGYLHEVFGLLLLEIPWL